LNSNASGSTKAQASGVAMNAILPSGTIPRAMTAAGNLAKPPGGSSHLKWDRASAGANYVRVVGAGKGQFVLRQGCSSCHDPHGKTIHKLAARAFDTRGQLIAGAKPVFAAQVCFGCHAGPDAAPLAALPPDLGLLFSPGRGSSHGIGRSVSDRADLPSLRVSTFKDRLDCTSCHASPDATGLRGPHVSRFPSLLRAAYGHERDVPFLAGRHNDLCYLCHDQRSIESNQSFPLHREHLTGFRNSPIALKTTPPLRIGGEPQAARPRSFFLGLGEPTSCATCHDPHGSLKSQALISFDPKVVTRSSVGGVDFSRSGLGHGTCTLSCHGYDHIQTRY
jgi:hypothetical protein